MIVDDMLTLARLEGPGHSIHRGPVGLLRVVEQLENRFAHRAEAMCATLSIEIDPPELELLGDEEMISQIIENLLDNALRHSGASEVGVPAVELENGGIRLTVWDTGQGIPSVHLDRIFERFYRVDPSRSRATGGTGLGLAIVKHSAESMGAKAWVESTPGQGTSVHVEFPPD